MIGTDFTTKKKLILNSFKREIFYGILFLWLETKI